MGNNTDFKKHFLVPAFIGAAFTYGVHCLTDNEATQLAQISALENRILDLELLLNQKEEELADARFFSAGAFAATSQQQNKQQQDQQQKQPVITAENTQPASPSSESTNTQATPDNQQLLRDLGTRSDRDPRSFSEKAGALLASGSSEDNIAIVSKSVFDMADNREMLPDYELESLYQQQGNPELQRVVAQVMSTRGDNRLLEKQIAKSQTNLSSDDPQRRQQALVELGKTRYVGAASAITPLLQDKNTNVKLDALLALRATGNQSHVHAVEALLNDPDPAVSWLANDVVNSLQNLSDKARSQLASADIAAELPAITAP